MKKTLKKLPISFCSLCMNRLHHIRETLPRNMLDNLDYPEATFVLLDYNSTDGLEDWVKEHLSHFIVSGKLLFYRFTGVSFFHRSHSRNLAFKAAPGEIICNVDADNFIGTGFANYINEKFSTYDNIFLTTIDFFKTDKNYQVPNDVLGRVCMRKEDFMQIEGYDERMTGYGFEDYDLANRLEMHGLKRILIQGEDFLRYIPHDSQERYSFNEPGKIITSVYIKYTKPWESTVLFLFQNHEFSIGAIIDNTVINADETIYAYTQRSFLFEQSLKEDKWYKGRWEHLQSENIRLKYDDGKTITIKTLDVNRISDQESDLFYLINNESMVTGLTRIYLMSGNRSIMEDNLRTNRIFVNGGVFGEGHLT